MNQTNCSCPSWRLEITPLLQSIIVLCISGFILQSAYISYLFYSVSYYSWVEKIWILLLFCLGAFFVSQIVFEYVPFIETDEIPAALYIIFVSLGYDAYVSLFLRNEKTKKRKINKV